MTPEEIRKIIHKLLNELEEEDVGISLMSTHYQNSDELAFFEGKDRERVVEILHRLSEDSKQHKKKVEGIVEQLETKLG